MSKPRVDVREVFGSYSRKLLHDFREGEKTAAGLAFDRGLPRERALREFFQKRLPGRYGVGEGLVIDQSGQIIRSVPRERQIASRPTARRPAAVSSSTNRAWVVCIMHATTARFRRAVNHCAFVTLDRSFAEEAEATMGTDGAPEHETERDASDTQNVGVTISEMSAHMNARFVQVAITPAQLRIVRGIQWLEDAFGRWPSAAAVAAFLCVTASTVVRHLVRLRRLGVVARSSTRVVRAPTGVMRAHAAANLFPMLPDAELSVLAADIKANGLVAPIVTIDGHGEWLILDGRNRARACELAGVRPTTTVWSGKDPVAFVVSANLHRRHLNSSQRAMIAESIANLGDGVQKRHASPKGEPSTTQAEAAALMKVSKRSVERDSTRDLSADDSGPHPSHPDLSKGAANDDADTKASNGTEG